MDPLINTAPNNRMKFHVLDALRGIAALCVAYLHFGVDKVGGYLAVDFFFVLSGFILAYSYHNDSTPARSTAEFVINRIARLYPLHLVTFMLCALMIYIDKGALPDYGPDRLFSVFQQLTLTHNVGFNPSGGTWNYPAWSISVEFWVGIIFIVFIRPHTSSLKLLLLSLASLILLSGYFDNMDISFQNMFNLINGGIVRCLASFLMGILAFRSWRILRAREFNRAIGSALELLALGLTYLLIFKRQGHHSEVDFYAPVVFYLGVIVFAMEKGVVSKLLYNLRYLGQISYSIYLLHIPVLMLVWHIENNHHWFGPAVPYIFFSSLVFFAAASYHIIESPSKKWLTKLLGPVNTI